MSRILLITNPSHDDMTRYLDAWSEKLLEKARDYRDIRILEVREGQVNKAIVTKLIEEEKPQLVIFNGHGDKNCIKGYELEILIQCGDNEHLLRNTIIHALSCRAGQELGPRSISIGGLAYIGYKENFKLAYLVDRKTNEEKKVDSYAVFILEPAFKAILSLIEGKTVQEAYLASQELSIENLRFLTTSKDDTLNTVIASRVYHNYINQVCLGDRTAYF